MKEYWGQKAACLVAIFMRYYLLCGLLSQGLITYRVLVIKTYMFIGFAMTIFPTCCCAEPLNRALLVRIFTYLKF